MSAFGSEHQKRAFRTYIDVPACEFDEHDLDVPASLRMAVKMLRQLRARHDD